MACREAHLTKGRRDVQQKEPKVEPHGLSSDFAESL